MQRKRGSPRRPDDDDQPPPGHDGWQSGGHRMGMAEYVVVAAVLMAGAGVAVSMAKFAGHAQPDCVAAAPSGGGSTAAQTAN